MRSDSHLVSKAHHLNPVRFCLFFEDLTVLSVDDEEINEFLKALAIGDAQGNTMTHDDFISFLMSSKTSMN